MNRSRFCGLVAMSLMFAACGASKEPEPQKTPAQETVFDDLTATQEKARRDTEQAIQQSKERNEKAIEQSESGRAP